MLITKKQLHVCCINEYLGIQVNIVLTNKCNYACKDCYMRNTVKDRLSMDRETLKKSIDFARSLGEKNGIVLFGGEPTLELESFKWATEYAHSLGLTVKTYTNGWWGNDDKILKEIFDTNIDLICLSVDTVHNNNMDAIEKILLEFSDHPTTKVAIVSLEGHTENAEKVCEGLPISVYVINYVDSFGRDTYFTNFNGGGTCLWQGYCVFPDGTIKADCPLGWDACKLGSLHEDNIFEKCKKYSERYAGWIPLIPNHGVVEYCVKHHGPNNEHDIAFLEETMKKFPTKMSLEENMVFNYGKDWRRLQDYSCGCGDDK